MVEQIKEMIEQGYGQRRIAQTLNISRDKVRTILKNNKIKTNNKVVDTTTDPKRFATLFNQQYTGKFVYVGGYINNVTEVKIKCLSCGDEFKTNASSLRHKINIPCKSCKNIKLLKGREEQVQHKIKYLESIRIKAEERRLHEELATLKRRTHTCKECHEQYYSVMRNVFCSDECMKRYNNATKKNLKRKRIAENGTIENITLTSLIKRDKSVCHLCGGKCDRKDYIITNQGHFVAGKNYPSIDHVIPVSKGGTHTWDNVKLAHMSCNSIKSDNSCYEMKNNAMRMCI